MIYESTSTTLPASLAGQQLAGPFNIMGSMLNASENTPANVTFVGGRCKFMLVSDQAVTGVAGLRIANPNIIIGGFFSPYFATGDELWAAATQEDTDAINAKYGLRDEDDNLIFNAGPTYPGLEIGQSLAVMDVRNPAWQDYFAAQMAKYAVIFDFDVIFLDTMTEDIPLFALGPGNKFPKGYSTNAWKHANYEFLSKVQAALAAVGKEVYANGISKGPSITTLFPNKGMLEMVAGGATEVSGLNSDFYATTETKLHFFQETIMKDLRQALGLGKKMVIEAYTDTYTLEKSLYFLGCVALIQNGNLFPYLTTNAQAGTFVYRDEWGMNLGAPPTQELTINNDGTCQRQYPNGLVVVNPQDKTVKRQVTMQPFTAHFFLD